MCSCVGATLWQLVCTVLCWLCPACCSTLLYWQDQFDTIDLSDNDIRKVEGFPMLRRLKMLIINNNRVW